MEIDFETLEATVLGQLTEGAKQFQKVVVAASGGVDSTVLFHLLCQIAKKKKYPSLALLHVNFGLRGNESDEDERFVTRMAEGSAVTMFLKRCNANEVPATGVQSWAREIRRQEYQRLIAEGWTVALAHHQDDVAENVLMRLARGSNLEHLSGMEVYKDGLWRPLFHVSKQLLYRYAKAWKLAYRVDRSNEKTIYTRNRLRLEVFPHLEDLFPGAGARIADSGLDARDYGEFAKTQLLRSLGERRDLDVAFVAALPPAIGRMAIRLVIERTQGQYRALPRAWLEQARLAPDGHAVDIPGGGHLVVSDGKIKVVPRVPSGDLRSRQYSRYLSVVEQDLVLGSGATIEIPVRAGHHLRIVSRCQTRTIPLAIRVPRNASTLRIGGMHKRFKTFRQEHRLNMELPWIAVSCGDQDICWTSSTKEFWWDGNRPIELTWFMA